MIFEIQRRWMLGKPSSIG